MVCENCQSHRESKSYCQDIVPLTNHNIIHEKNENDCSSTVQPKIGDAALMSTNDWKLSLIVKLRNEELSGIKSGVQQQHY